LKILKLLSKRKPKPSKKRPFMGLFLGFYFFSLNMYERRDFMPSGKTHEKINWVFLLLLNLASFCLGYHFSLITLFFTIGYVFGTYFLGPDLDTKSRPFYRWKALRFIWIPYRKTFHHRSFWTHGLVVGDLIRIGYLCMLYLLLVYGFAILCNGIFSLLPGKIGLDSLYLHHLLIQWMSEHFSFVFSFIGGIVIASAAHIIADHTVSYWKRKKRKKHTN